MILLQTALNFKLPKSDCRESVRSSQVPTWNERMHRKSVDLLYTEIFPGGKPFRQMERGFELLHGSHGESNGTHCGHEKLCSKDSSANRSSGRQNYVGKYFWLFLKRPI